MARAIVRCAGAAQAKVEAVEGKKGQRGLHCPRPASEMQIVLAMLFASAFSSVCRGAVFTAKGKFCRPV